MASREFIQFSYQLERGIVKLYARVNIGATGAPTLVTTSTTSGNPSKGILSVARQSAGKYRITFGNSVNTTYDRYQRVLRADATIVNSTVSTINGVQITDESQINAATPYIDIQLLGITAGAVAAVEANNGDVLLIEITLKNSQV